MDSTAKTIPIDLQELREVTKAQTDDKPLPLRIPLRFALAGEMIRREDEEAQAAGVATNAATTSAPAAAKARASSPLGSRAVTRTRLPEASQARRSSGWEEGRARQMPAEAKPSARQA